VERSPAVVVDAGPLYALVDRAEPHHRACRELLESLPGPLVVPMLAIAEVAHFIGTRLEPDVEVRFLSDLAAGTYAIEPVHPADWLRIAELVARYRDLPLGTVDASIVAAAERLGLRRIVTLDRRHFSVVRPQHVDAFELMP
jgi:predicted nucleic acid-binding protein